MSTPEKKVESAVGEKQETKEGEVGGLSLDDVTGTLKLISKVLFGGFCLFGHRSVLPLHTHKEDVFLTQSVMQ
jgi:hypothetical protein